MRLLTTETTALEIPGRDTSAGDTREVVYNMRISGGGIGLTEESTVFEKPGTLAI